jgi:hypothetical protein
VRQTLARQQAWGAEAGEVHGCLPLASKYHGMFGSSGVCTCGSRTPSLSCRCKFERGEDDKRCLFYQRAYNSMCPPEWVSERPGSMCRPGLAGLEHMPAAGTCQQQLSTPQFLLTCSSSPQAPGLYSMRNNSATV